MIGQFAQTGGINDPGDDGLAVPSGVYELSAGQIQSAWFESVGSINQSSQAENGVGQFIQSGGANNLGTSTLNVLNGSYQLTDGQLSAGTILLGVNSQFGQADGGNAVFVQAGGEVIAGNLQMPHAEYNMSGGTLEITNPNNTLISGTFNQSGGTSTFGGLDIGDGTIGTYLLSGNSQLNAYSETIGDGEGLGNGTFTQNGAINDLGVGTLTVANYNGTGTYSLLNGGHLICGNEYIGYEGGGVGTFVQTDSTSNVGELYLGYSSYASYTMNGSSLLTCGNENIGHGSGNATFTQNGGTNNLNYSWMYIANGGFGEYFLNAGFVFSYYEYVGDGGNGTFVQAGGTNSISNTLDIASVSSSGSGSYFLSGGRLSAATETIGGIFDQTGGVNSTVTLLIYPGGTYDIAAGGLQITKPFSNSGTFDVQNPAAAGLIGTNILTLAPLPITGAGTLIVERDAALYAASIVQNSLIVGGELQIVPGSAASTINSLDITTGTLDITNNGLIIDYPSNGPSPLSAVRGYIHAGYANGAWDGPGIVSSTAAGNVGVAVGYAEASALGISTFGGVAVDNTAVLVRYTWVGDANLDGVVDSTDLAMMQTNGSTWSSGDFNYDGQVNADDYALFELGMATSGGNMMPVPEGKDIFAGLFIPLICRRRARQFKAQGYV